MRNVLWKIFQPEEDFLAYFSSFFVLFSFYFVSLCLKKLFFRREMDEKKGSFVCQVGGNKQAILKKNEKEDSLWETWGLSWMQARHENVRFVFKDFSGAREWNCSRIMFFSFIFSGSFQ